MVLRKSPPPRLQNISNKRTARSEPRSTASPASSLPSPGQLACLNRIPSQDSIYSPDLNTSPAFDLMPLEEAQKSPVGSPTSYAQSPWPDDIQDHPDSTHDATTSDGSSHLVPAVQRTGPQPGPAGDEWRRSTPNTSNGVSPVQLQSNNPFLKPRTSQLSQGMSDESRRDSHTTSSSGPLSQCAFSPTPWKCRTLTSSAAEGYIPMTARLSLWDENEQETWTDRQASSARDPVLPGDHQHALDSQFQAQPVRQYSDPQSIYCQGEKTNPYTPPVVVTPDPSNRDPFDAQQTQQPHAPSKLTSEAGLHIPSATISSATTTTSHELIDFNDADHDHLGVETESHCAASSVYSSKGGDKTKERELMDTPALERASYFSKVNTELQKLSAQRKSISAAEAARQKEQRSETYAIRHVNWIDRTGQLQESSVLVQNKNGPCPLLALINALVLRADPKIPTPILKALQTREQISLGLLIEAMFEELTMCLSPDEEFPDIEALAQFLTMLHTGMNVNPRLTLESADSLGSFFQTSDLRLYSTFRVPLIHGWIAPWSSPTHEAMTRVAQYHEDIQLLHFRKQELEERVMRDESLTSEEEQVMADIQTILSFVDIETATQLSPFGLTQLTTRLAPGSVSILFRNDHFSTLYKHPTSHQLYSLVTDAGYANHAEVVWESLVDVTGFNARFLSGDFRPVGNDPPATSDPAGPRTSSTTANRPPATSENQERKLSSQEQSDADYAYALSLQFQEEEQRENARNDRRTSSQPSPSMNNPPNRTSSAAQPATGPDPNDPNAPPPSYEQAANGPAYSPPQQRYQDTPSNRIRHSQSHLPRRSPGTVPVGQYDRNRDRNKDCIVM
ncbi:hypothetical protein N7474_000049 [Penicillium riverlandense]|uniref:uncharacterized protein n=1 Tax=Penicillium riverlandense TaxID=1903569 RepID=UPI00254696A7|nr:uncharacterized protein N7474_000049 [Penicillium riverlandense]KAJ5831738.1 hypothetical protein N7474_000049 [Penicillium riverlandense]